MDDEYSNESDENSEYLESVNDSESCLSDTIVDDHFIDSLNEPELDKDKLVIVDKKDRISKNLLTSYEFVRIIGERTKQLTLGAKPLLKDYGELTYEQIAIQELKNKIIPYQIRRVVNNKYEIWDLDELRIDHLGSRLN